MRHLFGVIQEIHKSLLSLFYFNSFSSSCFVLLSEKFITYNLKIHFTKIMSASIRNKVNYHYTILFGHIYKFDHL